jgi:hypothetical protein
MSTRSAIQEFSLAWLPQMTNKGITRLLELLESASPYLIHGRFGQSSLQGCLATHIAWNHPKTAFLRDEAGICWLTKIARLNPATSHLVVAWDEAGLANLELRFGLIEACYREQEDREYQFQDEFQELVACS